MPIPSSARLHDFEVVSNERIAAGIFSMEIASPRCARAIRPGQFVNVAVPGDARSLLRLPLSYVRTDAAAGSIIMWYAVVGDGTERLSRMKAGEVSTLLGPGGRGWSVPAAAHRALLVCGGIGVPPVLCLAHELHERGIAFDVCTGAMTASALVGVEQFRALGAGTVCVSTDDGTEGLCGFCTEPAAGLIDAGGYDYVATCGPAPMMRKAARLALEANIPCEASLERMMGCGFGACGTCNVETIDGMRGACMCGPVFDAAKVVVW